MRNVLTVALVAALLAVPAVAQNQSATFSNGTPGSIDVPYNAALMAPPGGVTVEAWVTYDGSTLGTLNRFPTIIRANTVQNWSYFLRVNAGGTNVRQIRWAVRTTGAGVVIVNWDFNPGDLLCWTHIAATYDGTTSRLFVNGAEVGSIAGVGPIADNGGIIGIGEGLKNSTYNNEIWNGQLDEVRVWSFPVPPSQIKSLMFAPISTSSGLEGSWHLDGDATDATGNGNDGTIIPTVTFAPATLPATFEYEGNDPAASLDINGFAPSVFCGGQMTTLVGQAATMNLGSTLVGNGFDVAVTLPELLVLGSGGAPLTPGGQLVNIDVTAPSFAFLFGGTLVLPFPGSLSLPLPSVAPVTAAAQMLVLDPTHPDNLVLSSGVEYIVQSCPLSTNFDNVPVGVGNYPAGWSNGGGATAQWQVHTGTTTSASTGPITGAFSAPNYMYCETSGVNTNANFVMDTCHFDVASLTTFTLNFRLSRIGATIGTLNIYQDNGTGFGASPLITYTGPEPMGVDWTQETLSFVPTGATVRFRFDYTAAGNFTGDIALDDVSIQ